MPTDPTPSEYFLLDETQFFPDDALPLIELTDVVQPASDYSATSDADSDLEKNAIIELTDKVPSVDNQAAATHTGLPFEEDSILDLIDLVEPESTVAPVDLPLDLSLDLPLDLPLDLIDQTDSIPVWEQADDDLIDLTDLVPQEDDLVQIEPLAQDPSQDSFQTTTEPGILEQNPIWNSAAGDLAEEEDGIIELKDILGSERPNAATVYDRIPPMPIDAPQTPMACTPPDEAMHSVRKQPENPPEDHPENQIDPAPVLLTPLAIEKAIEHMICTQYGQTVDQLIASVVERVVVREMQTLKRSLMEEDGLLE